MLFGDKTNTRWKKYAIMIFEFVLTERFCLQITIDLTGVYT